MTDLKAELLRVLQGSRASVLAKLDGLSEYDRRRPLTPTGTNLLGLAKHLAGLEYGYLGEAFGRPPIERPSWFRDDPSTEIDMWATPDESSEYITGVYRQACAHSDLTVAELDLDSPGHVAHWAAGHRETTLGVLLIRMVGETAQHAGHAGHHPRTHRRRPGALALPQIEVAQEADLGSVVEDLHACVQDPLPEVLVVSQPVESRPHPRLPMRTQADQQVRRSSQRPSPDPPACSFHWFSDSR